LLGFSIFLFKFAKLPEPKIYPNNLVQYSPKIKAVTKLLDRDSSIDMEVVLVTGYK
jgi:hypothetical protein